jgi:hypothetical protein
LECHELPTKELATTEGASVATVRAFTDSPNDFANVLAEYGITPETVTAPKPPLTGKANFQELCALETAVQDEHGEVIKCTNHTGPLMFLAKKGESDAEGKFAGYDGFYIYEILHPVRGKLIVTIGRAVGDVKPGLVQHLDTLVAGNLFQVAQMPTAKGFKVFQAIPVQGAPAAA